MQRQGAVFVVLAILLLVAFSCAQNIDIMEPIMRRPPSSDSDAYAFFGYKTILHRFTANPNGFSSYLSSTRIVVSAPNGTANSANAEPHTGVLYLCSVTMAPNNGECEPLTGDRSGADNRLYDTQGNSASELKRGQFLGVDMDSVDGNFIVCAHRYISISGSSYRPLGRCFYTQNQNLQGFDNHQPCNGLPLDFGGYGVCQAGTSAVFAEETSGGNFALGVGAPGTNFWRGALLRSGSNNAEDRTVHSGSNSQYNWLGYTMTKGHIASTTRQDFIVSLPRSRNYFGQVNVIQNDENLATISQSLQGRQMGEYFGFSLLAASLTQTQYDDVIVSAPMHTSPSRPERGRVYLFRNTNGVLSSEPIILNGPAQSYVRFGHAMANLGDINNDGLDDVAISAPFGDNSPGFVYIYLGSPTEILSPNPVQVINGSEVLENINNHGVSELKAFGSSLSSGLDVDGNLYNDLVVGSYEAQRIFLLRTRPAASMVVQLTANPTVVDVQGNQTRRCNVTGTVYACFEVSVCGRYTGLGLLDTLNASYVITGDRNSVGQQRLFFEETGSNSRMVARIFTREQMTCFTETVLVRENIVDIFNGFTIDVQMTGPSFNPTMQDGNPANPTDLRTVPFLEVTGSTQVSVDTLKECDSSMCIPNLNVEMVNVTYETQTRERVTNLVSGLVTFVNVWLNIRNMRDNAYLTQLTFDEPVQRLTFTRIEPRSLLITCNREVVSNQVIRRTCLIANPLQSGANVLIAVRLQPTSSITGSEGVINLGFSASSINPELNTTLADNTANVPIAVTARADIHLDQATASPELVTYANVTPPANLSNITQLGARTDLTFVVVNEGPTTIPTARLSIFWPYRPSPDTNLTFLYPAVITTSTQVSCTMANRFINPENYPLVSNDGSDDDITRPGGEGEGQGRKRSLDTRQAVENNAPAGAVVIMARNITINCRSNPEQCVEFVCDVRQLSGPGSAQVTIGAHLDGRFFADKIDRYTFNVYANVTIVGSSYIEQPASDRPDETTVTVRAVTMVSMPGEGRVEPWVIIVPIVLSLLAIAVLGVILYMVGFFKRQSKQKKEELQAKFLAEQDGGDPPAADVQT